MSDKAQRRLQAIGQQLQPPIKKVAAGSSSPRVQGKVVIITGKVHVHYFTHSLLIRIPGANSPLGIGRATAHQYAESGARAIYLCDFNDSNLEAHKQEIATAFPSVEVHTRQFDAAEEAKVKEVVDEALNKYGRLDVFFANAGVVGRSVIFTDFKDDEFMSILKTNTLRYV